MRQVVLATFTSLDGVMQAPGGPEEDPTGGFRFGGWCTGFFDEIMGQAVDRVMDGPFDLLLGRKTYEIFAAHWPYIDADAPDGEIATKFAAARKYVATSGTEPLTWEGSISLGDDAVAAVRELKAGDGPKLVIQGSSELVHALLAEGLIDEITLMMCPVVFGKGKRIFGDETKPSALALVDQRVSTTGVLIATYRPAGEVQTGSFAMAQPTEAELERRERMKREG